MSYNNRQKKRNLETVKGKKSIEYTLAEAVEGLDQKEAPKWTLYLIGGVMIEVLIVGIIGNGYGVYKLYNWLF